MEKNLLSYDITVEEEKRAKIREAIQLLEWGADGKRHQPVKEGYEGELYKMYLYLTFRCPNHCSFCYANGGERVSEEMTPEQFAKIIQDACNAGFRSIALLGGEPLAYPFWKELLALLETIERGETTLVLRSSLSLPLSDQELSRICSVFDEVITSIDGDEKRHDSIRGEGCYGRTVENLKRGIGLGRAGFGINSVMSEEEFKGEQGEAVRQLCKELKVERLSVQAPVPLGRGKKMKVDSFSWRNYKEPLGVYSKSLFHFSCGLGHNLYVEPDGKVFACYAWCDPQNLLGDLHQESLSDLLERPDLLKIMNSGVDTNQKCRNCKIRYLCGGMCKIYAANKTDIDSADFDCESIQTFIMSKLREYLPKETFLRFLGEEGNISV